MKILAFIGFCAILCAVFMILDVLGSLMAEAIRLAHIKDIQKHRFDKPPTAKCYCIDCISHSEDGYCRKFGSWCTADNWFCWAAEPSITIKSDTEKGD